MKRTRERIDVLLVERGLCESRSKAQARVLAGEVVVDDQRVDKPGERVPTDAVIRFKGEQQPWVSRGGIKLAHALDAFHVVVEGRTCVDVGASTGGFTDVLLTRGAARVYCVDVGRAQLHEKLRTDVRVINLESTHVVKLAPASLQPAPTLAVVDVSFISLRQVLPAVVAQLAPPGAGDDVDIVALIKPQFEVGRAFVGKGGIVTDVDARRRAVDDVLAAGRALSFEVGGVCESPITGADGNVELLVHFARAARRAT